MIHRTISITDIEDEKRINEVLYDVWGVRHVTIHANKKEAVVSFDEEAASLMDFKQALRDSGINLEEETMKQQERQDR
ncbi:heavy-metal-associated domain-containing protein [Salibacterium salarium]|uniref:heavy-metal-associated domain-containing protein n=1 Tax=Salibacterium salarium TaxID=284579 RepID=UPI0016397CE4|nr:cation transporter [Salibacterium salarium]